VVRKSDELRFWKYLIGSMVRISGVIIVLFGLGLERIWDPDNIRHTNFDIRSCTVSPRSETHDLIPCASDNKLESEIGCEDGVAG